MACGIPASLSNRAASPATTVLPTPTGPVTSRTGTGAVIRSGQSYGPPWQIFAIKCTSACPVLQLRFLDR
jgi:hypothetical protein